MSKYNKSQIFKSAWNIKRKSNLNFSQSLKKAWDSAKSEQVVDLENMMLLTKLNSQFVKETEKAVCYKVAFKQSAVTKFTQDGYYIEVERQIWIPKSAIKTLDDGNLLLANWYAKQYSDRLAFIYNFK